MLDLGVMNAVFIQSQSIPKRGEVFVLRLSPSGVDHPD